MLRRLLTGVMVVVAACSVAAGQAADAESAKRLEDEERERASLRALAEDPSAAPARRSEAYALLAGKAWNCSYDITEMSENKQTIERDDKLAILYVKPKEPERFDKALGCATDGLAFAEQALALNPSSAAAWAHKTNLLRERAKLAQMEGDEVSKAEFRRRAAEAEAETVRLRDEEQRRRFEEGRVNGPVGPINRGPVGPTGPPPGERPTPRPDTISDQPKRVIVRGGVLNGKAIHKPAPSYPREAQEARASGTVAVEIVVDEEGRVVSAEAVSGHELLREAAVEAARLWLFSPTLLSGQPVRISGTIIFAFTLD